MRHQLPPGTNFADWLRAHDARRTERGLILRERHRRPRAPWEPPPAPPAPTTDTSTEGADRC